MEVVIETIKHFGGSRKSGTDVNISQNYSSKQNFNSTNDFSQTTMSEEDIDAILSNSNGVEDDEFDDIPEDNTTEIMDAAKDDDTADDIDDDEAKPKEPVGYRVQKPEEDFAAQEKLFSSIAEARANSSVDPEEDLNQGPSVEDIMAAFNRKHGGAAKKQKEVKPTLSNITGSRPMATETTRTLKKVKVDAKILSPNSRRRRNRRRVTQFPYRCRTFLPILTAGCSKWTIFRR